MELLRKFTRIKAYKLRYNYLRQKLKISKNTYFSMFDRHPIYFSLYLMEFDLELCSKP